MGSFIVHTRTARDWIGLGFREEAESLIIIGAADGVPDILVPSYDPERDLFYRAPEAVTPEELEQELRIHFPKSFNTSVEGRPSGATIGDAVLIQSVNGDSLPISPLTSLRQVLESAGTVNAAILQADNGGLLFVRRAGENFTAHASAHSLAAFLEMDAAARDEVFPDFTASELLISGSDLDHFTEFPSDRLTVARPIGLQDFDGLVTYSDEAVSAVSLAPHLYTLAIGAGSVYSSIRRSVNNVA